MKKLYFSLIASSLLNISYAQIEVDANGHVGVGGVTPSSSYDISIHTAKFNSSINIPHYGGGIDIVSIYTQFGPYKVIRPTINERGSIGTSSLAFKYVYAYNYPTISDIRRKENIRPMVGNLDIINALNVFRYDYISSFYSAGIENLKSEEISNVEEDRKNKIGLMAQEVEKVLPEAVFHDDSTDVYAVDYTKIIPILIGAMKEQQEQIEELKTEIQSLQGRKED